MIRNKNSRLTFDANDAYDIDLEFSRNTSNTVEVCCSCINDKNSILNNRRVKKTKM